MPVPKALGAAAVPAASFGAAGKGAASPRFRVDPVDRGPMYALTGVTKDASGNALPSCQVHLFRSDTDVEVEQVTSDGSGNYTFPNVTSQDPYYVVAYLAGSPDVAGVTVNTLVGTVSG